MNAPFAELLEYLRTQGFPIGVESHLLLRVLLNQLGDRCAPADLKTILCPLFATNAEQQELFYRTFDAFYPFLAESRQESSTPLLKSPAVGGKNTKAKNAIRKWPNLLLRAAALLLILLVAVLAWEAQWMKSWSIPFAPAAGAPAGSQRTPLPPQPISRASGGEKSVEVRKPWSLWPSLARYSLGWAALLGVFWRLYGVYRSRRKQLLIRKQHGKVPPYSWPIQSGQRNTSIYDAHQLAGVSQLLHRRHEAESERLDVERTIASSIALLGFPVFQYRKDTRLPEYLFLIDRCNFRDHQACLFDNLAGALQDHGVFVNAWFYEGDPRICWDKPGEESLDLEELQRRFSGRRLLILGDGDEFLDPVTGRLAHWHRLLRGWRDRALLTPRPPPEWSIREYTLATQFLVAPATLDGLNAVGAYFETPDSDELDFRSQAEESLDSQDGPDLAPSLRRRLGDAAFQWLCACAIYPELHWDLTLRLGSLPSMPPGLVQETNIIRLLRLPWFRTGSIPDDLRRKLIAHLDPTTQREVRESIIHLLENNPAPTSTYAADTFQFQIAYQRYRINPRDRKARRRLQDAMADLSSGDLMHDYAYLEAANSAHRSPLHVLLPDRLRKFLPPTVGPSFGLRTVARSMFSLATQRLGRRFIIAAIAASSVIVTLLLGNVRFFQLVHLKAGDLHFLVRGKRPTSNVVLVTMDQKTLESFRELKMFWHPYYAEAIRAAAEGGAKVLGLDVAFGFAVTKYEPENDRILAEAVNSTAATMPTICVYLAATNTRQQGQQVPVNMIAAAFNQNAYANLTADPDDFIRNQELVEEPGPDGQFSRGLAFRVAEKFRGVDATIKKRAFMWAGRAIPALPIRPRTITINYAGPPGTFPRVSLSDFIAAARAGRKDQIGQWVGGKAVLLGPDNDIEDRHATPFYTAFSGLRYNTAGVEIQANILRTLLDDDYLVPVWWPVRLAALTAVAAITAMIAVSAAASAGFWLAGGVAAVATATHLMFLGGLILSTSELLLAGLSSLLVSIGYRFLTSEKFASSFRPKRNSPSSRQAAQKSRPVRPDRSAKGEM